MYAMRINAAIVLLFGALCSAAVNARQDKSGKTVVSGNFRYASSFSGGLARIETMTLDGLLFGYVDRDGKIVWDYEFFNDKQLPHHDICKMPNGNVLMIVWDKKTVDECVAAGRKKELVSKYLLPDSLLEVKPTGATAPPARRGPRRVNCGGRSERAGCRCAQPVAMEVERSLEDTTGVPRPTVRSFRSGLPPGPGR
jgi:hypothetical protein